MGILPETSPLAFSIYSDMKRIKLFEQFILEAYSEDHFKDYNVDLGIDNLKDGVLYLCVYLSDNLNLSIGFLEKDAVKEVQEAFKDSFYFEKFRSMLSGLDYHPSPPEFNVLEEISPDSKYIFVSEGDPDTMKKDDEKEWVRMWYHEMFRNSYSGYKFVQNNGEMSVAKIPLKKTVNMNTSELQKSVDGFNVPIKSNEFFGFDSYYQSQAHFLTVKEWLEDKNGVSEIIGPSDVSYEYLTSEEEQYSDKDIEDAFFKFVDLGPSEDIIKKISKALRKKASASRFPKQINNNPEGVRGIYKPLTWLWALGDDSIKSCPECTKEQTYPASSSNSTISYYKKEIPGFIQRKKDNKKLYIGLGYIHFMEPDKKGISGHSCPTCENSLTPGLISEKDDSTLMKNFKIVLETFPDMVEKISGLVENDLFTKVYPKEVIIEKDPSGFDYEKLKKSDYYKSITESGWSDITTTEEKELNMMTFSNPLFAYKIQINPDEGVLKIFSDRKEIVKGDIDNYLKGASLKTTKGYYRALGYIREEIS